ncbi:MAG: hypothetical protein PVJ26_18355 [Anaerolineae bacterium]|jgi:Zn-dependent protease
MDEQFRLGRLAGLELVARPSAAIGSLALWLGLALLSVWMLRAPLREAIVAAFLGVVLHWLSDLGHHLGHAWAARRAGYPMAGVRFYWLLGTSLYPPNEPPLSAGVHIRRALGGPLASALLTLLAGLLVLALWPLGGALWWIAAFVFADNLLVFTLGALLPLGFTDGSTLLEWSSRRDAD